MTALGAGVTPLVRRGGGVFASILSSAAARWRLNSTTGTASATVVNAIYYIKMYQLCGPTCVCDIDLRQHVREK